MFKVDMKKILYTVMVILSVLVFTSCSINRFAVHLVANALTGTSGGTLFTGDDDPELIADALPFALKMYEGLLQSDPENVKLLEAAGSGFISYANAFLQSPAELMGYDKQAEKELMLKRAVGLYRRGSSYISKAIELKHPGFSNHFKAGDWDSAFAGSGPEDVSLFYWKAAAVLGEFSIDTFNPELMLHVPEGVSFVAAAFRIDPDYNRGALHELLLSIFASIPDSLIYRFNDREGEFSVYRILTDYYKEHSLVFEQMSSSEKAEFHFNRAVDLSTGLKVSPYVSFAVSVCVKEQNYDLFRELLTKALNINPDLYPADRLVNIIGQRKAHWYLDHSDDFFIVP